MRVQSRIKHRIRMLGEGYGHELQGEDGRRCSTDIGARAAKVLGFQEAVLDDAAFVGRDLMGLDSIDLIGIVNSRVRRDPSQCKVAPGDAVKAMIMAMVMGAYRPVLENIADRCTGQPMELCFVSVDGPSLLDLDMLEEVPQASGRKGAAKRRGGGRR